MKLASLKNGKRDGRLVVVSRDLTRCADAAFLTPTLQAALDDWRRMAPHLAALSETLEHGSVPSERFHEHDALSPLPRCCQWANGTAYANSSSLAIHQGGGTFAPPRDPIAVADDSCGIDFEGAVAVIVDDVPMGCGLDEACEAIRLVMLVNDICLRGQAPDQSAAGLDLFQSKPSCAFSPVAVTPDELGGAWDGGRVHLRLNVDLNGKPFGRLDAGADMKFDFPALITHAARTRPLRAGSVIGSGAVSNRADGGPGAPLSQGGSGYSSITEQRAVETMAQGAPATGFMRFGDNVRIEMKDRTGHSVFGAIEQTVTRYGGKP